MSRGFGLTRWLVLVLGGIAVIEGVNAARLWVEPREKRVFPFHYISRGIWSVAAFFRPPHARGTDIRSPCAAVARVVQGNPNIYADFSVEGFPYNYPPSSVVVLLPLGWIADRYGVAVASQVWDVGSRLCAVGVLILVARLCRGVALGPWPRALLLVVLAAFYPLRWMLMCVQLQSLLTLCLVLALWAYARGRGAWAGLLLGLAAAVKPYVGLIVLFAAVRRQWTLVAATLGTVAVLGAGSVGLVGLAPWKQYCTQIMPLMAGGYGVWPNQSLLGLVQRFLGYTDLVLRPPTAALGLISSLAVVLFTVLAAWPRPVGPQPGGPGPIVPVRESPQVGGAQTVRALDLALGLLAVTLGSPIAWEHYFAWMPVLYVLCLRASVLVQFATSWWVLLAASYVLLGTYFLPVTSAAHGVISLVNAGGFVGAALALGGAWHAQVRLCRAAQIVRAATAPLAAVSPGGEHRPESRPTEIPGPVAGKR